MKKSKLIAFFLFLAGALVFAQTAHENGGENDDFSPERDVLRIIENRQIHNLNPHTTSFSADAQILEAVYEGLYSYDPQNASAVPALAVKYSISRDKKRWTFILREDACFSNGTKITSEDVRSSWIQLLATPDAPYSSLLDVVEGARDFRTGKGSEDQVGIYATGPYKLMVKLVEPVPYLPNLISHYTFAVIHRNPTVYSGAFYIHDYNSEAVVLKKNAHYWDAENVKLSQVEFYQSLGADDNTYAFNTGLAHWLSLSEFNNDKLLSPKSVKLSPQFGTEYLFFRTKDAKPGKKETVWDRPDFRLALLEAMPWDTLREISYFPAQSLVPKLTEYPSVNGFSYTDLDQAKVMMADARKNAGISEDERIPLKIELNEHTLNEKQERAIIETCNELGINVKIIYRPFVEYMQRLPYSDADIAGFNWIGDYADPLAFLDLFKSESTMNTSGWKNADYDGLISRASLENETSERYKILAQAEQLLLDEGMVIPICTPLSVSVINTDEVGGWYTNVFNIHPLKYLFLRDIKTTLPDVI